MTLPAAVARLVETFDRNKEAYLQGRYNETQLRREFIDPFFKALGWDIDNESGYAEAYKDVIHEDAIRIGQATKAPDYCFRIGGTRKFFLEAKKPSVNIKGDPSAAYQLRRYAWSAKLPLSILTDFEEFAVYDCRVRPHKTDKPSTARIIYLTYDEYAERWDEIASRFSREAVLKGSFDKYAQSAKRKRGTAEVDAAFLGEIEQWRDTLARNIALRNADLSNRELNFAVQRTIDRIIFLRICEDRGIEPYKQLQGLTNGLDVYQRLVALFRRADDRYNSGLFHFMHEEDRTEGPDELTPELVIDDKPLKEILRSLYYPDSPYEFSVLPAEILGHVYEQFLGKVITLTPGHRARVDDKPEVKKAGGVYYTPSYIVDYIVEHTVGKLLEGASVKSFKTIPPRLDRPLRVLDPACGSGSFLLGAYQTLLDWYQHYYEDHDPHKWAASKHPPICQAGSQGWKLTTAERKRILLDHIYGVDIDTQAVEVTKLSLLLRVLEGEKNLVLFHDERALPDLADNIKCGNSLIGPDFYEGQQLAMFDDDERLRINAFDWKAEFPQIFKDGGFDAVIGNPPYVRQENLKAFKAYLKSRYDVFNSTADLYVYFIARAIELLRAGGYHAYIVSRGFFRAAFGVPLRRFLRDHVSVCQVVDFGGLPVFSGAKDTYVAIPVIVKNSEHPPISVCNVRSLTNLTLEQEVRETQYMVPADQFHAEGWATERPEVLAVFRKVARDNIPLGSLVNGGVLRGLITGLNEAFEISEDTAHEFEAAHPNAKPLLRRFLGGQDIRRYHVRAVSRFLIAIPCGWTSNTMAKAGEDCRGGEAAAWRWFQNEFGRIAKHLAPFAARARARQDKGEFWWELRPCDYYGVLEGPKIIYPDIAKAPRFHLDTGGLYIRNTAYCLACADPYLVGVLNSTLMWFAIARISIPFGTRAGEYRYRMFTQYVEQLPIRRMDSRCKSDSARYDHVVGLVDSMLELHKSLASAKTPGERNALQRQIDATDKQIDQLVYELYGLTDDEIRIVEEAT
ncbi:MAG: N-6 DNA methylase [Sedimentisphaerales bacterium]|nr:N-6 DNA methylase [Sedimentisphaerales bacterium]